MEGNSPNPPETVNLEVWTAHRLQQWLRQEGGNHRCAYVLAELAELAEQAIATGQPPPQVEMDALRGRVQDRQGGRSTVEVSKWLSRATLEKWWAVREPVISALLSSEEGATRVPVLKIVLGGGRSNPNLYSIEFQTAPPANGLKTQDDAVQAATEDLSYTRESLSPMLPLRWLFPGHPYRVFSWRGLLILGTLFVESIACILVWALALFVLSQSPRELTGQHLFVLLGAFGITWLVRISAKPWIVLPERRVTLAPELLLPFDQPFGQLQLVRDRESKRSGWLSLVRFSAVCTECAANVELAEGGLDFPGRLIGRCRDSPLEHVYTFDPVSQAGYPLRTRAPRSQT
jgi:hypothetical protein